MDQMRQFAVIVFWTNKVLNSQVFLCRIILIEIARIRKVNFQYRYEFDYHAGIGIYKKNIILFTL